MNYHNTAVRRLGYVIKTIVIGSSVLNGIGSARPLGEDMYDVVAVGGLQVEALGILQN